MASHAPPQSCSAPTARMQAASQTWNIWSTYGPVLHCLWWLPNRTLKLLHRSTQYISSTVIIGMCGVINMTVHDKVPRSRRNSSWSKRPLVVSTIWIAIPFHRHHRKHSGCSAQTPGVYTSSFSFYFYCLQPLLYATHRSASLLTAQHSSNPSSLYPFIVRLKEK